MKYIPEEWVKELLRQWDERERRWGGSDGPGAIHECVEDMEALLSTAVECPECARLREKMEGVAKSAEGAGFHVCATWIRAALKEE